MRRCPFGGQWSRLALLGGLQVLIRAAVVEAVLILPKCIGDTRGAKIDPNHADRLRSLAAEGPNEDQSSKKPESEIANRIHLPS